MTNRKTIGSICILLTLSTLSCRNSSPDYDSWNYYAGTREGNRYSSVTQINADNVAALEIAWIFNTGDKDTNNRSQIQCNPIIVNGILYGTSPKSKLFALNAATGEKIWLFDPALVKETDEGQEMSFYNIIRGVVYWKDERSDDERIFYGTGHRVYAVDAKNGHPVADFGHHGYIDLAQDLDAAIDKKVFVGSTSPGVIYKDLLIMGTKVKESLGAAPGHVRAYDARTGKRRWIFHTIPHPGEPGYDSWEDPQAWEFTGGANSWAGLSLDERRGVVYVPTGSATPDFYGAFRKGQNLFANSLIALNAETGDYLWHFQIVHHDLWDRDLPANPNLVTIFKDGKEIDAVAQVTKHGYIFVFDRVTGKPVFQIEERPVRIDGALPNEAPWPTQPIPLLPEPFARQQFNQEDVNDLFPETYPGLMEIYHKIKNREMFSPPSKEGAWIFPGYDGGGEWGGAAVDVETQILYINSTELPWMQVMEDYPSGIRNDRSGKGIGFGLYVSNCAECHGTDLKGKAPSFPSLLDIGKRYNENEIRKIITRGRNMMPGFSHLSRDETDALVAYILKLPDKLPESREKNRADAGNSFSTKGLQVPYKHQGYDRFLDPHGYPGIKPPWGTLNAVSLNTGKLIWKVPLGEYDELTLKGIPPTGTENYGGPLVTKGGLVFIAATKDEKIRAFDKRTGETLWKASLPAAGYATPATYSVNGRQYIVIACGGGKIGSKSGDSYVAFALPQ